MIKIAKVHIHAITLKKKIEIVPIEVKALVERLHLDRGLRGRRQCALGALARGAQPTQRTRIRAEILLVLLLELSNKVIHHAIVKVLTAQMRVAAGGLHLEEAVVDRQK